ncbi:MAG: hypothetical protein P4M12_12225 [Gammaproteobacteria bacterium]|nr:hypothetical protein [Gammaproteobacteria bacterium]
MKISFSEEPGPLRYENSDLRQIVLKDVVDKELLARSQQAEINAQNQKEFEKKRDENELAFAIGTLEAIQLDRFFEICLELHAVEVEEVVAEQEQKIQQEFEIRQQQIQETAYKTPVEQLPDISNAIAKIDQQIDNINALYDAAAKPLIAELNKWEQTEWAGVAKQVAATSVAELDVPTGLDANQWQEKKAEMQDTLSSAPSAHKLIQHNPYIKDAYEKAYAENMQGKEGDPVAQKNAVEAALSSSTNPTYHLKFQLVAAVQAMALSKSQELNKGNVIRSAASYANNECASAMTHYASSLNEAVANQASFQKLSHLTYERNSAVQSLQSDRALLVNSQNVTREMPLVLSVSAQQQNPIVPPVIGEQMTTAQDVSARRQAKECFLKINEMVGHRFLDTSLGITAPILASEYVTNPKFREATDSILNDMNQLNQTGATDPVLRDKIENAVQALKTDLVDQSMKLTMLAVDKKEAVHVKYGLGGEENRNTRRLGG